MTGISDSAGRGRSGPPPPGRSSGHALRSRRRGDLAPRLGPPGAAAILLFFFPSAHGLTMIRFRVGLCVAVSLAVPAGCSSKNPQAPAKVSGQVLYKGQLVTGGSISFHSQGKGIYQSAIAREGTYEI